jgi:hypothetical protein
MHTKQILLWVLILSVAVVAVVGQPSRSILAAPPNAASAASKPALLFPQAVQYGSGLYLTAIIGPTCADVGWYSSTCLEPYAGEFVVTALNGAEVTRVMTNYQGQALVDLPPGRYIVGVRTENIYPYAAPMIVNVMADRYAYVSFRLESGVQWQARRN